MRRRELVLLGLTGSILAAPTGKRIGDLCLCRRLMTVPGVGPVVAVTFKSAVDDPSRIAKSKAVGALFGLTPKKYQSGEKDVAGGITRTGDGMVRTALYEAANVLLSRITRFSKLKRWGMDVAKRRGSKRAKVALARKIGVILHRVWIDGTTYRWGKRSRSQRRVDQGGIRDASGPSRGPYCPKSRRRDGGAGEAVTRPVAVRAAAP
jgi:hypothetical protein